MTTLLYTHPACIAHDPGEFHPESPDRLRAVLAALEAGEFAALERREAPRAEIDDIARVHFESYGTKVYTEAGARALFPGIDLKITHVLTPYDLRYSRSSYLPSFFQRLVPSFFGYFMVLEGRKPMGIA